MKDFLTALDFANLNKTKVLAVVVRSFSPEFKNLKMLFSLCLVRCMQITEALVRTSHAAFENTFGSSLSSWVSDYQV